MKHTLLSTAALATALALTGCGNSITNSEARDAVVGPPLGSSVVVTYGNASTEWRHEGTLRGIGREWVGVERGSGSVLWIPAHSVRLIEQTE
ncbi:hypothetical protein Pla163_37140 [Planctomycetes bacterium Pla163]|uniref:Uncharacterized protein n=1 Tax=Rohdeia mirabilis TaxID=2528008 RepID=A0A518D513_9BACT|nr:hypothetical protein Pla163_37140 [Planctomycetes bacterium Pla163]